MSIAQRRPALGPSIDTRQRHPHISAPYRPTTQPQPTSGHSSGNTTPSPLSSAPSSPAIMQKTRPPMARHASTTAARSPSGTGGGGRMHRVASSAPHSPVSRTTVLPAHHQQHPQTAPPIEMEIFAQILDLDDDDGAHACSRALVAAFFQQARTAHRDMLRAYAKQNPTELAALGHFLMGSAAALGIARLSYTCRQIERHGTVAADLGSVGTHRAEAMATVGALLGRVEGECVGAERWLGRWYEEEG
ncbi:hypothetical protein FIBSPDRAFT_966029 [Athelia psychrophila]|uniref:HPt domain-containing protein n=1 Tax=Athelia psychrophila TaxID=1759441 RepID=A0A167X7P0_9AGAM|nr:hypothetical protein FIBSPDRAFT_966029 [Fibularhizoctonia sp. CBS 109695]